MRLCCRRLRWSRGVGLLLHNLIYFQFDFHLLLLTIMVTTMFVTKPLGVIITEDLKWQGHID